ncbi:hypothetical protein LZ554_008802 [Drepanopeziza brunnea f. sp. 'monogermtubi']|nr:hypothetical protein LZ554_008802 [Drepanopeziza brunnea f. sp. 'monogermtubi']
MSSSTDNTADRPEDQDEEMASESDIDLSGSATADSKNKIIFDQVVQDILKENPGSEGVLTIGEEALKTLEEAAEDFLVEEFEAAGSVAAKDNQRVTVSEKDMRAARELRENLQAGKGPSKHGDGTGTQVSAKGEGGLA